MKTIIFSIALSLIAVTSYSQFKYSDLEDLNTICKKEDFEAAKNFLTMNNYVIEEFKTNYDHGSYYVLCYLKAKKSMGTSEVHIYNGQPSVIDKLEEIEIDYRENTDNKELVLTQNIRTDRKYEIPTFNVIDWSWKYLKWTHLLISNNTGMKDTKRIGDSYYSLYPISSASQKQIPAKDLLDFINSLDLSEDRTFINADFENCNPSLGDIKDYRFEFHVGLPWELIFNLSMRTTIYKGENVTSENSKVIKFPLNKNGNTYSLNIKFGKLVKTYILDSGASDMSIDDDTYGYLDINNEIKIEDRLSDAKYQLADGSTVVFKRVRIPSFTINDVTVKKIEATRVQNGKPLLLGKSFLDSFKSWKIDNENQTLIVEMF